MNTQNKFTELPKLTAENIELREIVKDLFKWQSTIHDVMPREVGIRIRKVLGDEYCDGVLGLLEDEE